MPIRRDKRDRYVEVEVGVPPEPLWVRCEACGELVFRRKLQENQYICPRCGAYFFLSARERIASLADPDSFQEFSTPSICEDPLGFSDQLPYKERVHRARQETGLFEAVLAGSARIGGIPVILAAMDFRFIGGSMGVGVGEILRTAMELAAQERKPFVLVVSSGGARVQEGVLSLLQMVKVVAAREALAQAAVPYIAILTYPSTGGVLASIGSIADVTIAEEGALIGFAGPRVIEQTTGERLPPGFQTAKFAQEHGMVDAVVPRAKLREELLRALSVLVEGG
ncbi:MAG: acetyl-CoA carboxylase carboxyl transferase subunit beta [Candidatus Bipolaricaulota bacterium]|nr:acetyl-CoA carboxylase carboxyl transferase subunit beta [Candidatus Bipolaricaulota bacterium]MDW8126359.1 acetyl-CoA carboxylase carboxyltransferase subunit beta [Candidatus Bipolaricaulota bacterium]